MDCYWISVMYFIYAIWNSMKCVACSTEEVFLYCGCIISRSLYYGLWHLICIEIMVFSPSSRRRSRGCFFFCTFLRFFCFWFLGLASGFEVVWCAFLPTLDSTKSEYVKSEVLCYSKENWLFLIYFSSSFVIMCYNGS